MTTRLLVTSNKGHIGHCFSAAGVAETVLGLESLKRGVFLPTLEFAALDAAAALSEGAGFLELSAEAKQFPRSLSFLLKNSFGFGGVNNSLLFRKLD